MYIYWDVNGHGVIMIIQTNVNYPTSNTDAPKFTLAIYSVDQPKQYY